jgi:hypothetical protein
LGDFSLGQGLNKKNQNKTKQNRPKTKKLPNPPTQAFEKGKTKKKQKNQQQTN